jgi:hypothetical protein
MRLGLKSLPRGPLPFSSPISSAQEYHRLSLTVGPHLGSLPVSFTRDLESRDSGPGSTFPAPRLAQSGERPSPSESDLGPQGINAGAAMPSPFIELGRCDNEGSRQALAGPPSGNLRGGWRSGIHHRRGSEGRRRGCWGPRWSQSLVDAPAATDALGWGFHRSCSLAVAGTLGQVRDLRGPSGSCLWR